MWSRQSRRLDIDTKHGRISYTDGGRNIRLRRAFVAWLAIGAAVHVSASPALGGPLPTLFLSTQEGRLAYDDTGGTGPLVIAMPGIGDLRQEYRYLTPILTRAGYRVVTIDLRGFGGTSPAWRDTSPRAIGRDFLEIETHLVRQTAVLIGNSYAAGGAVWAAHDAPGRVTALVLLGPSLRDPPTPPPWYGRVLMAIAFAGPWRLPLWLHYWQSLFPTRTPPDLAAYRRALARNLRQPGRMAVLDAMLHASKASTAAILGQTRVPTLVVMGAADPDFDDPAAEAAWIASRTGAQVSLIPRAGHYPQAEMPEIVGQDVVRFLRGP